MQLEDKFIAFVDILGFASAVNRVESGGTLSLHDLRQAIACLGSEGDLQEIREYGPTVCPDSRRVRYDAAFELTQLSDCVVVSAEISPAGVITIIDHCWKVVLRLLQKGLMCRGHIRRGKIFHSGNEFIGAGYQEALSGEQSVTAFKKDADELGTPFVELDTSVSDYVTSSTDSCVREMYGRMVKDDQAVTAVYPFQRIFPQIGGRATVAEEKRAVENIRRMIIKFIEGLRFHVEPSHSKAARKLRHYEEALQEQLRKCDEVEDMLDKLSQPYPYGRL